MYQVNQTTYTSFKAAVEAAAAAGAEVFEVATGLRRWAPAPKRKAKTRHFIVNADGTETEFGSIRH